MSKEALTFNDHFSNEQIEKIIDSRENNMVIPLYVKMWKVIYPMLKIHDIPMFVASGMKIGYGTILHNGLTKNTLPAKHINSFSKIHQHKKYNSHYEIDDVYCVFESDFVDGEEPIHEEINTWFLKLQDYLQAIEDNRGKIELAKNKELVELSKIDSE